METQEPISGVNPATVEVAAKEGQPIEKPPEIETFQINVKTCGENKTSIPLQVSPVDNFQDIKQFLFESVDTCYITSYNLYHNGNKINEFTEIGDNKDIGPNSIIEMVEAPYDERAMRLQIRRLKEIVCPPATQFSPSLFSRISRDEEDVKGSKKEQQKSTNVAQTEEPLDSLEAEPSLATYYPDAPNTHNSIACYKNLVYSGWNPPPGHRKLAGDLLYLEITTLENRTVFVTGGVSGFFINNSSTNAFNPVPSENSCKSHTLVGLLGKLSSLFKKNFAALLSSNFQEHPFEVLPVPLPVVPWVGKREAHTYDVNRAEDSLLYTSGNDFHGALRDWNEEYQNCKELANDTIQERIIRDRALFKVTCDFVEVATKGACAIVERSIPPINPLDPEKAHMFIYNNIFFSYALDGRDFYKDFGGDRAAHVSQNNDLKGIKSFNRADVKGLYTLCTALIDYRGRRLCAQSIIPGILQREQTSTVVYGSIDNGKKIAADPKFHELLSAVGKELHIKEHVVIDEEGKAATLCTPVEAKGIMGTDGRRYVLDLVRVTPRDTNYSGKTHLYTILRAELIQAYCEYLNDKKKKEKEAELAKTKQAEGSVDGDKPSDKPADGPAENSADKPPEQPAEQPEEPATKYYFNPNALCDFKMGGDSDGIKQDEEDVKKIASFLTDVMIPMMVDDWSWYMNVPVDGQTLTSVMHARGINMRYLGRVATLAEKGNITVVKELAVREMITRAAKHLARGVLAVSDDTSLSQTVAHFLNCLLGDAPEPVVPVAEKDQKTKGKKGGAGYNKKKKKKHNNSLSLSTTKLWKQITDLVKERFDYDLPDKESMSAVINCVPTLRSICLKVGIQVQASDYDFTKQEPFSPEDILQLYPVVKHVNPESSDGKNLLEAGKSFLGQGRLDIAYELLSEALAIFHQVYGPMHRDTATCYGHLAMVLFHAKDNNQALDHQQRATIINERVLGLDHHDTSHSYGNLALFNHSMGKTSLALHYIRRALYLERLVCGVTHPDIATTFNNIATMLQDLQQHRQAIEYFHQCLKAYENLLGPTSIQTAAIYHQIAIAYSQLEQFKEALNYEKKNYSILHAKVGDGDIRAIESNIWLRQFTQKAVAAQMESQKAQRDIAAQIQQLKNEQLKNIQQIGKSGPVNSGLSGKTPSVGGIAPPNAQAPFPNMGSRPLAEILAYINEKPNGGQSFSQRNQKKFTTVIASIDNSKKAKKKKSKKKEDEADVE